MVVPVHTTDDRLKEGPTPTALERIEHDERTATNEIGLNRRTDKL